MRTHNLVLSENQSGKLQSGYIPVDPSNSWKIAPSYRLFRVDTIRQITHKSSAGDMASWKWASSNHEYIERLAWGGGEPPFRVTLVASPTSATAGGSGKTLTWTRTASIVDPDRFIHGYPQYGYEIKWQPSIGDIGQTFDFDILIESQDGQTLSIDWQTVVDNSKFRYFADTVGSDAADGSFSTPWESFGKGYSTVGGQNLIYCYMAGTYLVNNGTPMNDAAFDSSHCKSHIGIDSGVVFDVSTGNFSGGGADILLQNMAITGGRGDKNNVRQVDFNTKTDRFRAHKVIGDTTFVGLVGNDNPSTFFFPDLVSPAYHEDIAITDGIQSANSLSQYVVYFQVKNFILEGFQSLSPTLTAVNGGISVNCKDGVLDGTIRHCDISANCLTVLFSMFSQDWASCGNVDIHFCRFVNLKASGGACTSYNDQVDAGGEFKPEDYWLQRLSIDGLNSSPFSFKNFTGTGFPVNYTAILWESTASTIDNGTTGGVSVDTSSLKVADINSVSASDLGVRGHVIASTLVT